MAIKERGITVSDLSNFLISENMIIASNVITKKTTCFVVVEDGSDEKCLHFMIEKLSIYLESKGNGK